MTTAKLTPTAATALAALSAILGGDPAITPQQRTEAEDAVRRVLVGATDPVPATADGDRIIGRTEAAQILNCSVRYVTILGKLGKLRRIVTSDGDGDHHALGYSLRSVQDFISGNGK